MTVIFDKVFHGMLTLDLGRTRGAHPSMGIPPFLNEMEYLDTEYNDLPVIITVLGDIFCLSEMI